MTNEVLIRYLQDNNIPTDLYLIAYNRVVDGLKPRYFRFLYKYHNLSTISYKRVSWLRDVELYEISGKNPLPNNSIGLDAASAASVEALRLSILNRESTIDILDMCCAPGGKLLTISSTLSKYINEDTKITIVGLDKNYRRLRVCNSLLLKEGLPNKLSIKLICTDSTTFNPNNTFKNIIDNKDCTIPLKYDRIIVDVECSHEGSLRSINRTIKYWGINQLESRWLDSNYIDNLVETQCILLNKALDLCKSGGIVVYSTCSLLERENEGVVSRILNQRNDIQPHALPIKYCKCCTLSNLNESSDWPVIGSHLPKSCNDLGKSDHSCKNYQSNIPSAVLFNPIDESSTTDGQFIACFIKL